MKRSTLVLAIVAVAGTTACASSGRLAEYDFRNRTVAVVTTTPPYPTVHTGGPLELDGDDIFGTLVRIGSGVAKEMQAEKVRARLDTAVTSVDVSGRMADRVLVEGARQLRAEPVREVGTSDFEIEVRVRNYGIEADDWDSQASFFMKAEVLLLDAPTGQRIWRTEVDVRDPVNSGAWGGDPGGAVNSAVTGHVLAGLSVQEIERTLEFLADYCADRVVDELIEGLDRARG